MVEPVPAKAEPTPVAEGGAVAAHEPVAQETRPEWLDPRFKTPEDQAKAYREAEKMAQQKSQRAAELERQNQELLNRVQQPVPQVPEPNYDELFWQQPTKVIGGILEKQVQAAVQPFIDGGYQAQKAAYSNDPDFKQYEAVIDQIAAAQPQLKSRQGVVAELYRVAKSMDPNYEKRIEERIRAEYQSKTVNAIDGAGTPSGVTPATKVELTSEEQTAAKRFYPELTQQEAYKKYYESKVRMNGGA